VWVAGIRASALDHVGLIARGAARQHQGRSVVVEVHRSHRLEVVEPGVITADLDRAAAEAGLWYPAKRLAGSIFTMRDIDAVHSTMQPSIALAPPQPARRPPRRRASGRAAVNFASSRR
jgi:hypothetical protein